MAMVGEIVMKNDNIIPQKLIKLYDTNSKNSKTLDIADVDAIKHGGMVLWLLFSNRQSKAQAKRILDFKQKIVVFPEFVNGTHYATAYLYGSLPVIQTDYQYGFSGQFNFDILPQNQTSFLLTLRSIRMDYMIIIYGLIRVQYRYGQYTVFFETGKQCLSAQRKTNWSSFGDKGLIIEFNNYHQIVVERNKEKKLFDEMVFA